MNKRASKPIPPLSEAFQRHFWGRVDRSAADECWLWRGKLSPEGYGTCSNLKVHRIAYTLLTGPIEPGMTIDHTCRNRSCVNPLHLEQVSVSENVKRGLAVAKPTKLFPGARKRSYSRYQRRRDLGLCTQCDTPTANFRCDRCREIHNASNRDRAR